MTSNQHECDEAGTHGRLGCVATRRCWYSSKVIHCKKNYWRTNTTTGKYEYARQFFSITTPFYPSCLAPPAVTLRLCPSVSPSPAVHPSPSLFDMTCKFLSNLFGVKIFLDENLLDEKKEITVFSRTSQVPCTGVH